MAYFNQILMYLPAQSVEEKSGFFNLNFPMKIYSFFLIFEGNLINFDKKQSLFVMKGKNIKECKENLRYFVRFVGE